MKKPEICYVYFHVAGLWNPRQIREDFADMRANGGDWVFMDFAEDNPKRCLKFKTDLVHEAGMKVMAAPGRVAGLFAAGVRPSSIFAIQNLDALCRNKDGSPLLANSSFVACVNHPKFIEWFYPTMVDVIQSTGCDGVVYDEPKETHLACYCDYCKAMVEKPTDEALLALKEQSMADMMGRLAADLKKVNPASKGIAMLMPSMPDSVIERVSAQKAIDYIGSDGPMCNQGLPKADGSPKPNQKTSLTESAQRFSAIVRKHNKKVFGLTETFGVMKWQHGLLRENLKSLGALNLDMYSFNYYGHNIEDPEGIMEIIREAACRLKQ